MDIRYPKRINPCSEILKDLINNDAGFSVTSQYELQKILELNARPETILFNNAVKDEEDIEFANEMGVSLTTADSLEELEKI